MTVRELIAQLNKLPDKDKDIFVSSGAGFTSVHGIIVKDLGVDVYIGKREKWERLFI